MVLTQNLVAHHDVLLLHQNNNFQCECRDVGGKGLTITALFTLWKLTAVIELSFNRATVQ